MSRASRRARGKPSAGFSGNRILKWVLIIGTTLLCLLFAGGLGLKMWLKNYRESEGFRSMVTSRVAGLLKSEVELAAFKWEDRSVYTDGFQARGYEDAALSTIQLDGMRASFGGIAEQAWQIPEVTLNRMNLEFSGRRLPGPWKDRDATPEAAAGETAPAVPGWLQRFIPRRFETGEIRIDAANLTVLDAAETETFSLRSVQTELRPAAGGFGWEIEGRRGEMEIAGQPGMDIEQFSIRWQERDLYIYRAVVDLYEDAHIDADGAVGFPKSGGTDLDLQLRIANLDVTRVTGTDWEKKLTGTLRGTVGLTGRTGSLEGLKQKGTLHLDGGVLTDLPILDKIAKYTRNQRFKRLALSETSADFERIGDRTVITNLVVQSDGLSRIEGSMTIEGRAIAGSFRLGVTPGTLSWIPGAERKVFVDSSKGFLWTSVQVAGTLDDPREDLSARLVVAAAESIVEDVPMKAIDAARKSLENPTRTPSTVIEEGRKLFDTLVPLLPVP